MVLFCSVCSSRDLCLFLGLSQKFIFGRGLCKPSGAFLWVTRMGVLCGLGRVIHKNSAERVPEGVWNEEWAWRSVYLCSPRKADVRSGRFLC